MSADEDVPVGVVDRRHRHHAAHEDRLPPHPEAETGELRPTDGDVGEPGAPCPFDPPTGDGEADGGEGSGEPLEEGGEGPVEGRAFRGWDGDGGQPHPPGPADDHRAAGRTDDERGREREAADRREDLRASGQPTPDRHPADGGAELEANRPRRSGEVPRRVERLVDRALGADLDDANDGIATVGDVEASGHEVSLAHLAVVFCSATPTWRAQCPSACHRRHPCSRKGRAKEAVPVGEPAPFQQPSLLTLGQVAERLALSLDEVRHLVATGRLRGLGVGDGWVTTEREVERCRRRLQRPTNQGGEPGRRRRRRRRRRPDRATQPRQRGPGPQPLNLAAVRAVRPPETPTQKRRRKRKKARERERIATIAAIDALARAFAILRARRKPRTKPPVPPDEGPPLVANRRITVERAAQRLGLTPDEVVDLIERGLLTAIRLGKEWYTTVGSVMRYRDRVLRIPRKRNRHRPRPRVRHRAEAPREPEAEASRESPEGPAAA